MKIIIVGYGRLGRGVLFQLEQQHDVVVIEATNQRVQELIDRGYPNIVVGSLLAQHTYIQADIEHCDALIACTSCDEMNAVIARMAQQYYRVPKVIARLYDPKQVQLYQAFGIQTLATTLWGIEQAVHILTTSLLETVYDIEHGEVKMILMTVPQFWVGKQVKALNVEHEIQLIVIVRKNKAFLPQITTELEAEDQLYFIAQSFAQERLSLMLGIKE
ncbi:MAG: potassium channel family protein [Culicoidibacterales bacterium]